MKRAVLVPFLTAFLLEACGWTRGEMVWHNITDTRALCNDFSQAGYFIRKSPSAPVASPQRWLVFLEGGGFCSSPAGCNVRYFRDEVLSSAGTENTAELWKLWQGEPTRRYVSHLMTAASRLFDNSGGTITIEGRDLLDTNCSRNPTFCDFNHVLIPYCSSDLWLLNDTRFNPSPGDFHYKPNATSEIQFVFRGAHIFRSALLDLNIPEGSEVVLAGSSAGGVGALNHANWTAQRGYTVRVVMDSSWFVDFRGVLSSRFVDFNATEHPWKQANSAISACQMMEHGFPCCVSPACVLASFSPRVPVLAITSLYDAYLLGGVLSSIKPFVEDGILTGVNVDFSTVLGEYGGAMNVTLDAARLVGGAQLSYYVTECSQHIYLDTSSLWGTVFGTGEKKVTLEGGVMLKQSISSIWDKFSINTLSYGTLSIRKALSRWYNSSQQTFQFRGTCYTLNCSGSCPDMLTVDSPHYKNYPVYARSVIASLVLAMTAVCVVTKLLLCSWLRRLEWRQETFLGSLATGKLENLQATVQFPVCTAKDAISVACLNLCYEVTTDLRSPPHHHRDMSPPVVLSGPSVANQEQVDEIFDEMCPDPTTLKHAYRKYTLPSESTEERLEFRKITQTLSRRLNSKVKAGSSNGRMKRNSGAQLLDGDQRSSSPSRTLCCGAPRRKKEILKGITLYFNPKQLTALMGHSGCGKTTLLDILTGRRKKGTISGDIYINGVPLEDLTDWYVSNTGYLLQSGASYYEELTVRENLTLSSQIKLPQSYSLEDAFARVEQVMAMTDLLPFADVVVGTFNGPGLSGGQKRRLAVALQLLKLPSVIFLDEPTSGLDATSSQELLTTLNRLADSNRTVVLTIHQPRLEIFHMFHRLVVLCDGQIAYNGAPAKAYEVFVNALNTKYLSEGYIIPELESQNPADVIMDMLRTKELCQVITEYYENTDEPKRVVEAIRGARNSQTIKPPVTAAQGFRYAFSGPKRNVSSRHAHWSSRLAAMEARAMKRASFLVVTYLPIFFLGYGILLGTAYNQTPQPTLIISGFCVYSVASALFMFPFLFLYYERALQVYGYEQADGAGKASDIVIQGFIRAISMAAIPVVVCGGVLYILLIDSNYYSFEVFAQVMLVNLALNQTWVALLICVICAFPNKAFRISPVLASVAGFASGFFIPREKMPKWYKFLFYINPNYYGFSASSNLLLRDFGTSSSCTQNVSSFNCLVSGSSYTLKQFNFDDINPYENILVLFVFTIFYLILAVFCNWVRHNTFGSKVKRVRTVIRRVSMEHSLSMTNLDAVGNGFHSNSFNSYTSHRYDSPATRPTTLNLTIHEEVEDVSTASDGYEEHPAVTLRKGNPPPIDGLFLRDGETHNVWRPGADEPVLRERTMSPPESAPVGGGFFQRHHLWERQKEVEDRVQATQQALKHEMRELATSSLSLNIPPEPSPSHLPEVEVTGASKHSLKAVSMLMLDRLRKEKVRESVHFHDVVKMCLEEKKLHSGPLSGSVIQLHQHNASSPLHFFPPGSPQTPWQVTPPISMAPVPTATPSTIITPVPQPVPTSAPPITPKLVSAAPPATPRIPLTPRTPRPRAVPISIQKWREILQKEQGLDAISENTETEVSSNAELSPPAPSLKLVKRKNSISTIV